MNPVVQTIISIVTTDSLIARGSDRIWKCLMLAALLFFCLPLALPSECVSQVPQKVGPRSKSEEWIKSQINDVPYAVALEWLMGKETGWGSKRVIFVYLEPKYFSKDNLFLVFGHLSSKLAQPMFLNVTLLTDRDLLRNRVQNYIGLVTSADTSYSRLTGNFDTCCPEHFTGAEFDRYTDEAKFIICTDGQAREFTVDYNPPKQKPRNRVKH